MKSINVSNCDKWCKIKQIKKTFHLLWTFIKSQYETLSYLISTADGIVRPDLSNELNIFVRIWEIFSYQGDNLCQCGKSRLVDIIIKVSSSFSCSRAPAQFVCHNHNPEKTLSMIGYGSFPPSYFMFYNMEKFITPTDVFDQHKQLSSQRYQEYSLVLHSHSMFI